MKKLVMVLVLILAGCMPNLPSVCDTTGDSLLCELAAKQGVRLEDVGNVIIIANAIAIGNGVYSKEQAVTAFKDIRAALLLQPTYLGFRGHIQEVSSQYPGLLEIAEVYLSYFISTDDMSLADVDIMRTWLTNRIKSMEVANGNN